ncbi:MULTISPECIES: HEAT repeat domain-containing protein [unclassified Pseudoclavibacter]|uniref:HEAT repeat domain-containing protein n=1 Tax=unclassified Pseudoclavibacter TaxID=2615177 RepID=UPI001301564C|nr:MULTISPECIES: HEAT repeat domain-containing protein [unclassified Pseudoclavibacter]KAB1645570.1 HEAT repeat domain-containing protein [Pseudoclavibacter sp. CFCC 14310]KAB1645971.1 HEAT repeat domain-containing protein [Pseudoclavibacter sp. CFCC 14310]KAB1663725.1 HEAT repeat domain-containing protein [Pseudoclavibacter sp. CFCC 13611]KAB1664526.1 HEAT repeat domain-containing protein [Pseudoclavibacter sp. CFCC 13611]
MSDVQALLATLADHAAPPESRQRAALEVGRLADPETARLLVRLLWDEPEFFVRESIVWALVRMGRGFLPQAAAKLTDSRAPVRAQAVHLLSKVGAPEYADAVLALLDDPDPAVAVKARWMLAQLHDLRLLPRLMAGLGSHDPRERDMVDQLITGYGAEATPLLTTVLRTGRPEQREQAVEVLTSIGSPDADGALPDLRRLAERPAELTAAADPVSDADVELATAALVTAAHLHGPAAQQLLIDVSQRAKPAGERSDTRAADQVSAVARHLLQHPPKPTPADRLRRLRAAKQADRRATDSGEE